MDAINFKDRQFGRENEDKLLNTFQEKFACKLNKAIDRYSIFDYSSDDCFVELKTRKNTKDKYKDTMVGNNKIINAEKINKPVYFCFSFTDGLYYWKYNKDDLKNGNVEIRQGGRCDRGRDEYKDYAFIKTNLLEKI